MARKSLDLVGMRFNSLTVVSFDSIDKRGNMIQRCTDKRYIYYHNYGGRGIKVCQEWRNNFMSFYNWAMSSGYHYNLSIDRIDVNGNYEPSNCKWSTAKEQSRNKRDNHVVTINGVSKTLVEWSEASGIDYSVLKARVKLNWDASRLLQPVRKYIKNFTEFNGEIGQTAIMK